MQQSASQQIDAIIGDLTGWKQAILQAIRSTILAADSAIIEEVKWKMANRPEGLAVWSNQGIICFAEIWTDNIKLLFPKGAHLQHAQGAFNARLKSKDIRAIEYKEGDSIDTASLTKLVRVAIQQNQS